MKGITGIILAGGRSTRMGTEKGLVLLDGKPFVAHIINALEGLVDEVIIVSENTAYDAFGHKRVADIIKESGPIAGIHSGLTNSGTQDNLVLSCDVPLVSKSLLQKLMDTNKKEDDVVQFRADGRTIPLIGLYKKRCLTSCIELLENGERRLQKLVSSLNAKTIEVPEVLNEQVKNINTPDDLKQVENEIDN